MLLIRVKNNAHTITAGNWKLSHIMLTVIAVFAIFVTLKLIRYDYQLWLSLRFNKLLQLSCKNKSSVTTTRAPKLKIFCMVTTTQANHESKAIHVRDTWGKRCDQLLFLSSVNNASLPSIKICGDDDRDHLWCKTKSGFRYVYEHFSDRFDWFLKADDDSYVIIDNLRHFLSEYDCNSALYFGCKFKLGTITYMSGGAGYVLSREALRRFVSVAISNYTDSDLCKAHSDTGAEDVELGKCLQSVGVYAGDSRDYSHKPRFFPFEPYSIILSSANMSSLAPWFQSYSVYPHKTGDNCCSKTLISYHYVEPRLMHLIDFLLYNVTVIT